MTRVKLVLIVLVALFLIIQLIPLNQTNPPVIQDVGAPGPVRDILVKSCYDCHSNETVWPWYSRIAPGSFLITRDIVQGRKHLNFSEFSGMSAFDSTDTADEIVEMLEDGKMPLPPYLLLHPAARLTESEIKTLITWAQTLYP